MSLMEDILISVKEHAFKCDKPDLFINQTESVVSKFVQCSCGYECEIPFVAFLEDRNAKKLFSDLEIAIKVYNNPSFQKEKVRVIQKQKEEEEQRKKLEKRKNAIGSLEI